ncbi:hypothetical protein HYT55_04675 [Candidatus Woesearchaeota archaeon]|nr:hypothetical protein [Candidatus Woesearchaeota archaeon]
MEIIDDKTIILDRELSELDQIVLRFVHILEKHVPYVLISGYVSILFGRPRTTEDVDLFIAPMSKEQFQALYDDLLSNGFWSIISDDVSELYSQLQDKLSIRFAEKGKVLPNMEVKFVRDVLDRITLQGKVKVITKEGDLFVGNIEQQIAYKKFVLMSQKDLEDARHLQHLFGIDDHNINKYKEVFKYYGRL